MVMENWNETSPPAQVYVLCLTLDGIPLFTRGEGQIPFPIIGSINGVHMFAKNNSVELNCTAAENAKIMWKEYESIKLIIVNYDVNASEYHLNLLLDNIHRCMVMTVGANELLRISNIEKLKKKLKLSLPVISKFISHSQLLSNVTQMTDITLCADSNILLSYLNSFTEECQSEFGCLTLHGKVVAGTDKYWQLLPIETSLILHLMNSLPIVSASDIPIYLPNGSPTVPHRLLIVKLLENMNVLIVCGPEPSLEEVMYKYVKRYWFPLTQTLRICSCVHPRGVPPEIKLDDNLLGFMVLNTAQGKCLASFYPQGNMTGADQVYLADINKRRAALVTFYYSVVGSLFLDKDETRDGSELISHLHDSTETYNCMEKYKCYALKISNHQIFTLFTTDIATYLLGNVTRQILRQITKDRYI